jgi:hypothetical protein
MQALSVATADEPRHIAWHHDGDVVVTATQHSLEPARRQSWRAPNSVVSLNCSRHSMAPLEPGLAWVGLGIQIQLFNTLKFVSTKIFS